MTSFKINLTVVGVFVFAALATLVVALAVLAGRTGPTDSYYAEYANVAGLKFGSQVLFEGYPIGQVESVEPVETEGKPRFRIELSVLRGWKIPDDSVARSVAPGVLAPQNIAISAGKSATMLKAGDTIRSAASSSLADSFSSIAGNVGDLTERSLVPLVDNLNAQVTALGEIIQGDLKPLAKNANHLVQATNEHWPSIMRNADTVTTDFAGVSARLDRLVGNLDRTAINLQQASASLQTLAKNSGDDLQVGLREFRFTMESFSQHAEPIAQNLDSAALNLQEFSRQIRQNPGLLLRSPESKNDPVPPLRRDAK